MSQIPMEDAPFEEAENVMPKEHSVPPVQHEDAAALGSLEFTAQEVILEPVTTQSPVEQHMPEDEEPKAGHVVGWMSRCLRAYSSFRSWRPSTSRQKSGSSAHSTSRFTQRFQLVGDTSRLSSKAGGTCLEASREVHPHVRQLAAPGRPR